MTYTVIYGGAFNPPTKAHEAVVERCLDRKDTHEVWLMPSADRYDKRFAVEPIHRLAMLELVARRAARFGKVAVCRLELEELPAPTQTVRTYEYLCERYPERDFRFVVGSDVYHSMPDWDRGVWLQRNLPMMVMPRSGEVLDLGPNAEQIEPIAERRISSTAVRQRIVSGQSVAAMVSPAVRKYIGLHGLYR